MGYYFFVKNVTQKHCLNSFWKNYIPEISFIREIGTALDWNPSDIIILECEEDWAILKDGKWEWQTGRQPYRFVASDKYLTIDDNEVYEAIRAGVFVKEELQKYLCYKDGPRFVLPVIESKNNSSSQRFDFSDDEF